MGFRDRCLSYHRFNCHPKIHSFLDVTIFNFAKELYSSDSCHNESERFTVELSKFYKRSSFDAIAIAVELPREGLLYFLRITSTNSSLSLAMERLLRFGIRDALPIR
jgi:hypothetical protein